MLDLSTLDATLRATLRPPRVENANDDLSVRRALILVIVGGIVQGALMGTFALCNGGNALFIAFSALKVPLFLGVSAALCFPALRIFYTLWGLSDEWKFAFRTLLSAQAAFAAILASLAPLTPVFYLSGATYRAALLWNVALFLTAILAAHKNTNVRFQALFKRDARHKTLLKIGFGLWIFVAVQLAWNLRPFLGAPDAPLQFLRADAFSNAYLGLWRVLFG